MFRAQTIMKRHVLSVKKDTDIYQAIRKMVKHNITGLPVINDDHTIAGIVTEKDVLKLLYNTEDHAGNVEDFMTTPVVSFDQEDSLIDITESFINNHFRRVPITDNGKLVGIISRKDIIGYILKLRHQDTATPAGHA